MLGAIIGGIVGSRFEFNNLKSKGFELFDVDGRFTDDMKQVIRDFNQKYGEGK